MRHEISMGVGGCAVRCTISSFVSGRYRLVWVPHGDRQRTLWKGRIGVILGLIANLTNCLSERFALASNALKVLYDFRVFTRTMVCQSNHWSVGDQRQDTKKKKDRVGWKHHQVSSKYFGARNF